MKQKENRVRESSFLSLLTVLFVGLKLTGYIDWSWLWVTSPIWLPLTAVIAFGILAIIVHWIVSKIF